MALTGSDAPTGLRQLRRDHRYCTNQSEPDLQHPDQQRLLWKQMRVGCVYWQDDDEHWHKRVVWGQDEDFQTFGASLYRLACRCGYRQAQEKIYAADGGDWCWSIRPSICRRKRHPRLVPRQRAHLGVLKSNAFPQ
ncbi:MAG: hypothetical protein R3C01_02315 [Planctomycetaceae bacterium]